MVTYMENSLMHHEDFKAAALALLEEDAAAVEALLGTLYTRGGRCDNTLPEAMNYSLLAGGKRVRPALTLEFCRLFGGSAEAALPFGSAVEMIHTFSLIHDDLPCMDDDDLRRGRPTSHKVYGEANALLAGDGLALDAFGVAAANPHVSPEARALAVCLLSAAAGSAGMVKGQIMDMFGEENALTYEELLTLHANKTGALIRVSAQLGVLAAGKGMDSPEMAAAVGYAERVGLAFQILDDMLEVTSDAATMGKSLGGDAAHHKNTFLTFFSLEAAAAEADRLTEEAVALITPYAGSERLVALARYLAVRGN